LEDGLRLQYLATRHGLYLRVIEIGIGDDSSHRTNNLFQDNEICGVILA
jgi:hypothetical protein